MMPCRLRSLLLAVIVLSNCITWTASRHHFTHNVSGHRSRHRRQGAGLFLSASYVVPGGEGSGWGDWGEISACSRTCGGGVASQKRICLQFGSDGQPQCTGGDTKYFSCETQDCPEGSQDFRAIQCTFYNNESFRGIKYKWEPYTKAPNPCELNCMPHGERFYYRHKSKVVDGTRCNDDSFDVCVNGTCQPVGCDMMLGSNAREDKCRQCRGNGANCHTFNGLLDTQELWKGYNDMMLIPEGSTNIYVAEVRPSNNYLALRANNGTYYLNGDYHIDFPRSMVIAGALWYYERSQQGFAAPDKLRCSGPTNEPLYLSLLLQDDNVGIEYEYSLPSEKAPRPTKKYNWVHENFTPCTVSCGGGLQTRNVTCRSSEELDIVDDGLCDEGLKPPLNQTCNTQACPAQWVEGPWSQCSKRCGKGGTRSREIRCEKIITSGFPSIVSDKECFDALGPKPELYQECNVNASCPTWFTGPWKPCDKLCGEGKRTRQVVCYQKNAGRIDVLDDEECAEEKPPADQPCTLQLCDGVDWVLTDWTGCDSCLSTIRTRVAVCTTKGRTVVNASFCAYHPKPVLQEPCDVVPPCQVQWYATQWSKCSVECGKGVQTRQVFCGRFENDAVVIVNDSLCAGLPKYNTTKPCEVPKDKCPSKWYAGPWTECTKKCGGGVQYRQVMCLRGNKPANDCSVDLVLDSTNNCNEGSCNKDEIIPLDPKATPIMDEELEDCIDEEDYPEVGIDLDISDLKTTVDDRMFSDGTFSEDGSGMEFSVSTDFESIPTFEDTGSGFGLTSSTDDELFVEGLTKHINSLSSTDITETTDVSASNTPSTVSDDVTDDYNTTDTDYDDTESTITEDTIVPKKVDTLSSKRLTPSGDDTEETVVSLSTDESTITEDTSETDETSSTDSSWSTQTDETSEFTTETASGVTESGTTKVKDLKKKKTKSITKSDSGETKKTTVSPPTDESTVTDFTKDTSETESTDSSEISENYSTESSLSTQTDETTETGDTELTSEPESSVSESYTTEVTDLKKKKTTVSSKSITKIDSDETKKTTVSPPTDESTVTGFTKDTSETESTESSETSETYSTESSLSTQTDETTESGDTDLTSEIETSVSEPATTEVTSLISGDTKKTTVPSPTTSETESTVSSETSESYSTESSLSTQTDETTESGDTELTTETESDATETTTLRVTESSITTEPIETKTPADFKTSEMSSSETSMTSETFKSESTESTATSETFKAESTTTEGLTETESELTEGSSEASSTLSSSDIVTLSTETKSSSTESSTEKPTEVSTESTEPSSTPGVSTVAGTETTEFTTSRSITTEEATESVSTVSLSTESESGSTEPATEKSTEPSSTTEESTVAATTSNTIISSETAETAVSRSATTEETTESLSTISLSTESESESTKPSTEKITETEATVKSTESSSTIEMSTTTPVEETSEFITTESVSTSSYESTTEFTMSTTEVSVEETSTLSTSSEKTSETSLSTETIETSTTEETTLSSETTSDTTVQEASTKTTITTEVPAASIGTTVRDWKTTIFTAKPICRRRKLQCSKSKFGCCPDKKTAAAGPFDEGCPKPKTCKESQFKCCPDEISPALGPKYEGCPIMPCAETLFGCCSSDNKTAAEGNDQEGCPPKSAACKSSAYGCCMDGKTEATDLDHSECPEYSTTQTESSTETGAETETEAGTETTSQEETTFTETASTAPEGCTGSAFGCCFDNETEASGPNGQGCPCNSTKFGCCPDGVSPANGTQMEGCAASCNTSTFGCCPDGKTPAHGPGHEGCCLLYPFGCCPDNYKPADGPHLEGCGCQYARFGCCPDNVTSARGSNNEGCGCQYSAHGCCPDRHTEASGPGFEGCGCHTYQFGCCPDGVTIVKGPGLQGCLCYQSKYGCCGDGETAASGPDMQGCDCSSSKYGCCPDGITEAKGSKFSGCTDIPLNRQAACSLSTDRGSCRNYSVHWYYDLEYGGCSRFWYGGCEGNGNRFTSKEECEDVCVQPSPQDTCKLPKVKGACTGYNVRWYYDSEREQCSQFVFGGCLGNANNFDSRELCQAQCEPTRTADQCSLPIDRGSCSGNFGRWGFNAETRRCEQFIWGGCEGNSNRFGSEAACVQRCDPPGAPKPRCTQPQDVGNCTDKEALWSFSQSENRCVPFYYTGCGGNENRFDTEHSCTDACPSSYTPDVCTLPAETGDCANYRERWYFDTSKQRCRQFYYGGCGGNSNNFASQTECENRCSDFTVTTTVKPPELRTDQTVTENISPSCLLEKDPGPCTQMSTRWAYDYTIGKCTQFQYGGCGGNINNFPNEENCEYYCKPVQDICQLPMLSGPCEDSLMKWFYDASTDACNQFTYGGCEGNDNRFDSREDCERRCRTGPPPETTSTTTTSTTAAPPVIVQNRIKEDLPQACIVSLEPEECTRAGIVWHYETEVSDCVAYENKEAGKVCRNTGVFASEEACQRSCGAFKNINVCRYPSDPGPCQGFVPKYYFNQTSGNCHEFAYGGCLGSPNRFSSFDECLQVCRPEMDPCKLGPEPGNCLERFVMWYYDYYRDSCSQFTYTGCGGNDNRFESREDCEGRCRQRPAVVTTTAAAIEVADTTTTTTIVVPTVQPVAEECRTPDSLAPCGANITVFYYDSVRKVCVESDIGGCDHLENIHRTEEECERKCGVFKDINVCEARLDAGPCHASIPKFYWDFASGRCQPYTYGGCKGGANRFSFIEECEEVCGSTGPAPACLHPVETGSNKCGVPARRWRYSVQDADCIGFVYQGCDGNENNFLNYKECAERCKVSRNNGSNEVVPACSLYISECSRLNCAYGIEQRRDSEGCVRCSCKAPELNCEPMKRECETLRCPYGVQRLTDENGCDRCVCFEDPCLRNNCTVGEQCVAIAYRDPVTQEPHYSAQCRLITPEPPNCDRFDDECSRLQCGELGIQRVRTVEGCERCSCVPLQIDCEPLRRECDELKCTYSVERTTGPDGCERCRCTQHPCDNKECPEGDRCIAVPYRDPITQDTRYTAECRTVTKAGYCPVSVETVVARQCRRDCNDDADCRGVAKCCPRGCSYQCQEPDEPTVPTTVPLPYTTTHKPDIPEPPRASHETEPEVSGTEGGKATLRCLFHGNPPPKITWSRNEITIDADEGRYRLLSDGALEIVSLYRNDSGVYICIANNGLGSARQEVHLQVKVAVRTHISAPQTTLNAGSELSLPCEVDGYPDPEVYWTKDNVRLVARDNLWISGTSISRLTIPRLSVSDSGVYGCHAGNAYSSHYSTVQINVQGLTIPSKCTDNPFFANCHLIVRSKFCQHKYYSVFCCKSCMEAGQLSPADVDVQGDQAWTKAK